jgi:hypothetical protein
VKEDVTIRLPTGAFSTSIAVGLLGATVDPNSPLSNSDILHARFCEIERRILAIEERLKGGQ